MFKNIDTKYLAGLIEGTVRDASHNKVTTCDRTTGARSVLVGDDGYALRLFIGLFLMTTHEHIGTLCLDIFQHRYEAGYDFRGGHVKNTIRRFRATACFLEADEVDTSLFLEDEIGTDVLELCVSETETAIRNICAEYDI